MKIKELRQKTKEELQKLLIEEREKLRLLRFDIALKKSKNVREIRKTKKNIARILTLLKEIELKNIKSKNKLVK
ncbi:MAG: 50S ribosomal protein L29 [Patescibacteria group bacterium]